MVLQWNSRSAVANKNSLVHYLVSNNIDIAILAETWFKPNCIYKFKGYHVVRKDRVDGKAGVAILVNKKLAFSELNVITDNENLFVCGVTVTCGDQKINFLSVYRAPSRVNFKPISASTWTDIFKQINEPCVIGGDFNAHHALWGSSKNDHFGLQLLEAIEVSGYIILNSGSATRMGIPGQNKSVVDITFCSPDLVSKLHWSVSPDTLGSDHLPILVTCDIVLNCEQDIPVKYKWNFKKANWDNYNYN